MATNTSTSSMHEALAAAPVQPDGVTNCLSPRVSLSWWMTGLSAAAIIASFAWAYGATASKLVAAWSDQPDYSHGFLVPPLTLLFLWIARDRLPHTAPRLAWLGAFIVAASVGLRVVAGYFYLEPVDGWSIPIWVFGAIWMFGGWSIARWSLPSVLFLYFMIPLPFRMERWLSLPLRSIATRLSAWTLQCLGQPALSEGHTIFLGPHRLEVEQACSGLRMLVGITALAVAFILLTRKVWWERLLLLASAIPIALVANTARIVVTGLLYQYVSGDAAKRFAHDFAGIAMIVLSVALFACFLWYLGQLFPRRVILEVGDLLQVRSPDRYRDATTQRSNKG